MFNYCIQWSYTHTPPTSNLLKFDSKFCKPNKTFHHCNKEMSIVTCTLIFHSVETHIFTELSDLALVKTMGGLKPHCMWLRTHIRIYVRCRGLQRIRAQFYLDSSWDNIKAIETILLTQAGDGWYAAKPSLYHLLGWADTVPFCLSVRTLLLYWK